MTKARTYAHQEALVRLRVVSESLRHAEQHEDWPMAAVYAGMLRDLAEKLNTYTKEAAR